MKRFHVHVSVDDLTASIRFYSVLFAAQPVVVKSDYAKWMLDDPRINFAVSSRGRSLGIDHVGMQVESDSELRALRGQLEAADSALVEPLGEGGFGVVWLAEQLEPMQRRVWPIFVNGRNWGRLRIASQLRRSQC